MRENQQRSLHDDERKGQGNAWLIGGLAVLVLFLAWIALSRAGEDVRPTASDEVREAEQSIDMSARRADDTVDTTATDARIAAARVKARSDMLALQAKIEADATYDDVQEDINKIDADLKTAYANTSTVLQNEYEKIHQGLVSLGDNIQSGTGDALEALSNLALTLEAGVRADE
jgi:uncharacterized protein YdcH (DUF465 family)